MNMKSILGPLFLAILCTADAEMLEPQDQPPQIVRKLESDPNGFKFSIEQYFTFSRNSSLPLTVDITNSEKTVYSNTVNSGDYYKLECTLAPGRYTIHASPPDASGYWGAYGGFFDIASDGTMSLRTQLVKFLLKITPISPIDLVTVHEGRPTLSWQPIEGAVRYSVSWFEEDTKTRKVLNRGHASLVKETKWTFNNDVISNRIYEWSVTAYDSSGASFAYYSASYFKTE